MANITYLLGAGASAQSMPTINTMRQRFAQLILLLRKLANEDPIHTAKDGSIDLSDIGHDKRTIIMLLVSDLEWLYEESENHLTIDILAKKYFHTGTTSLHRLKKVLIAFFTFEQIFDLSSNSSFYQDISSDEDYIITEEYKPRDLVDKRYDGLLASMLENNAENLTFKENFKIVTWNYDMQLELAYKSYSGKNLADIQSEIQVIPNRKTEMYTLDNDGFANNKLTLIKLNGTATSDFIDSENPTLFLYDTTHNASIADQLIMFFEYYDKLLMRETPTSILNLFNFCWESKTSQLLYQGYKYTQGCAVKAFQMAEVLVVIGYSFPFFNKEVDDNLIKWFTSKRPGHRIYIQDGNADEIKGLLLSRYDFLKAEDIIPVKYLSSFFIPHEA